MGINGVHVKKVMLHLADNAAELWNISAENPVCVHPSEDAGLAAGSFYDFQKKGATAYVLAKRGID